MTSLPVTIIIPTYNRPNLLPEALISLINQSRPASQIIVVDDGSPVAASAVAVMHPTITYVRRDENQGKAAALNQALDLATYPFIWIFDDDDVAAPTALEKLYSSLLARPDCGFAYGLCDWFNGSWPASTSAPYPSYEASSRAIIYIRLLEEFFMWQGAMLVRRSCYSEVGKFDVTLLRSQDRDMTLRLARRFAGVSVREVLFHQRAHSGMRGPSQLGLMPADTTAAWKHFDQIILRRVHKDHDVTEFLIDPHTARIGPRQLMTGLIQRASIMARAGIWDLATADMEAAAMEHNRLGPETQLIAQEIGALRRIFERHARSRFSSVSECRAFFLAIKQFRSHHIQDAVAAATLWTVLWRIKRLIWEDPSLTQAPELFLILRCAGARAVIKAIGDRKLRVSLPISIIYG